MKDDVDEQQGRDISLEITTYYLGGLLCDINIKSTFF